MRWLLLLLTLLFADSSFAEVVADPHQRSQFVAPGTGLGLLTRLS